MKTALITGCSRGLGAALLSAMAEEGYDLKIINRTPNNIFTNTAKKIALQNNVLIDTYYADLADKAQLIQIIETILTQSDSIDLLINNAAYHASAPLFYMDYETVEQSFRTNYFAPFYLIKQIGTHMMRRGQGSIINITSVASLAPHPAGAAYDASKAALNLLTQSAAQELTPFGIRVNAIACSVIDTDMYRSLSAAAQKKILGNVALKRPASYREIIDSILFLASDKASYITGQILRVDGGYTK